MKTSLLRDKLARAQAAMAKGQLSAYGLTKTLDESSSKPAASWGPALRV